MQKIIEASELPENEKIYLKKDWLGWRVVEPFRNENNKIIWFKFFFGSKRMIFQLIIYILIGLLFYIGIHEIMSQCSMIMSDPCRYCKLPIVNFRG